MSGLFWLVLAVGMVVIGVVALGQFLGRRNHDRLVQKALSAIEDPNAVRAQLLEAIKAKSANERTVVSLRLFWAGSGIKSHEQYVIMKPLFDDQLIFRSDEVYPQPKSGNDILNDLFGWLEREWQEAFCLPVDKVVLSDREWQRMVHGGVSGTTIIAERIGTLNSNSISTGGGDVIGSPQSGGDMDYRSGDVRTGDRAILMLQLTRLHDALELDLPNVPGLANQADVHDLAADLKAEMEGAADPGKLRRIVERASFYASKIGEAMRYTKEVVDGFSGIHW